ncbi:MAG: hypothetical protein SVZ03_14085 [Spirochaetota bacterium]|nr:hypothetical protein [Spirochaetota bacterium]
MMDFSETTKELIATLKKYNSLLVCIKGSPDPDAIASSLALKIISDKHGIKTDIIAFTETSLPQNKAIIDEFHIPIHFEKSISHILNHDAYAVLDHQSAYIKDIPSTIPCAIHIDHHEIVNDSVNVDFKIIMEEVGSVSTIMALFLHELEIELDECQLKAVSTALLYGIQTDTDNLKHANELDYEAIKYLSRNSDSEIINRITGIPLTRKMIEFLGDAIKNKYIYKDWLITGIGFIDESYRDNIAIIADFLLNREDVTTVIVFAGIRKNKKRGLTLDASIRTEDENIDLNELIKKISSEGGARRYKGAYQIDMDYFTNCPDQNLLWTIINNTTIEVFKKQRDIIYLIELKGFFNKYKNRIKKFIYGK